MAWFRRELKPLQRLGQESRVPEGLWIKCGSCKEVVYKKEIADERGVCPRCSHHFRISARERLGLLFDGEWREMDEGLASADPLKFEDTKTYASRLAAGRDKTGSLDAVVSAEGEIGGIRCVIAAMEYDFIGGSMG